MLTKDLLRYRIDNAQISPAILDTGSPRYAQAARELITIFGEHLGKTLGELEETIEKYVASRTDYRDRKSTRLNSSHLGISYAVFCLKKKKKTIKQLTHAAEM